MKTHNLSPALLQDHTLEKQEWTQFLAKVTHDLRTPLTTMKGYSELLLQSPSEKSPIARNLAIEGQKIVIEVDSLFDLLLLESREIEFYWEEQSLFKIVTTAVHRLNGLLEPRRFELMQDKFDCQVICDKKRLIEAFMIVCLWLDRRLPKDASVKIDLEKTAKACVCAFQISPDSLLDKKGMQESATDFFWRFPLQMFAAHKAQLRRNRLAQVPTLLTVSFPHSHV